MRGDQYYSRTQYGGAAAKQLAPKAASEIVVQEHGGAVAPQPSVQVIGQPQTNNMYKVSVTGQAPAAQQVAQTSAPAHSVQGQNHEAVSQAQLHNEDSENFMKLHFSEGPFNIDKDTIVSIPIVHEMVVKGDGKQTDPVELNMTPKEIQDIYMGRLAGINVNAHAGVEWKDGDHFKNSEANPRLYLVGFEDMKVSAGTYPNSVGVRLETDNAHRIPVVNPVYSTVTQGHYVCISDPHALSGSNKTSHDYSQGYTTPIALIFGGENFNELKTREVTPSTAQNPIRLADGRTIAHRITHANRGGKLMTVAGPRALPRDTFDNYMLSAPEDDNKIKMADAHAKKLTDTAERLTGAIPDVAVEKNGLKFTFEPINKKRSWYEYDGKHADGEFFNPKSGIHLIFSGTAKLALGKKSGIETNIFLPIPGKGVIN